jgi:hypothetical protein
MATAKQRTATGSFSSASGSTADAGSIQASLNDFARASASFYPGGNSGTRDVPLSAMAAAFGQAQMRSNNQSGAEFKGTITSEGTATFVGFETGPAMSVAVGSFSPMFNAVHATAQLQSLDMSIYASTALDANGMERLATPSIPARASILLTALVRAWISSTYKNMDDEEAKAQVSQVHTANLKALVILKSILDASDNVEIEGLAALAAKVKTVNRALNGFILYMLTDTNAGSGYLDNVIKLANEFGMIYAPQIGGASENGRLISVKKAFSSPKDIQTGFLTFSGDVRPPDVPYTHVLIPNVPASGLSRSYGDKTKTMIGGQIQHGIVKYPDGAVTGRAYVASPPRYLTGVFSNMKGPYSYGKQIAPNKARSGVQEQEKLITGQLDVVRTFIKGYAREIFSAIHMQGESVSVGMVLTPTMQVGTVYRVSVADQGALFTGLLAYVTHSVNSSPNASGAYTQAQFSHVRWNGYNPSST